jgi:hypothetical protein
MHTGNELLLLAWLFALVRLVVVGSLVSVDPWLLLPAALSVVTDAVDDIVLVDSRVLSSVLVDLLGLYLQNGLVLGDGQSRLIVCCGTYSHVVWCRPHVTASCGHGR